jgi:hypothetical protein
VGAQTWFTVFAIYRIVIGIVLPIWGARIFGGWSAPQQIPYSYFS